MIFGAMENARYEVKGRNKKKKTPTISCHLRGTKQHVHGSLHAVFHRHRLRFKGATLLISPVQRSSGQRTLVVPKEHDLSSKTGTFETVSFFFFYY